MAVAQHPDQLPPTLLGFLCCVLLHRRGVRAEAAPVPRSDHPRPLPVVREPQVTLARRAA